MLTSMMNNPYNSPFEPFTSPEPHCVRLAPQKNSTMLGSLKKKLSTKARKDSDSQQAYAAAQDSYQAKQAPHTRRPAAHNPFRQPETRDPPPAYTPTHSAVPAQATTSVLTIVHTPAPEADDPYTFLSSFDTIFLIDDSGSMAGSRWREAGKAIEAIAPICTAHDADGIDIFFLNNSDSRHFHNVRDSATVREIFQTVSPRGGTPTGQRLNKILTPYLRKYESNPDTTKPINIICITDGEPSDDVESPLIKAAKKLDKLDAPAWQVGVQFFQVGRDEQAKRHLSQLDDELAEISGDDGLRDIVDTVPFLGAEGTYLTGDGILKCVLGAVIRRLDRKKSNDLHK
ncbi:hypothetical protein K431DRAFT_280397 [Polychaeton citri CBS 116435]|uniref:VWFA domain-containing protein n=1 Tax=Polychaeton citri CBS 116435 TaxID=1314669 RepID=A0A9P4QKD8_9PEZI|nr:hypothetical protein K431DRAFT_280397 [Polychaeton citri CBS 116435]